MKKILSILGMALWAVGILPAQEAPTQGWQWAKSYSGYDGQYQSYNKIRHTAFDSAGNVYICGIYGAGAEIDGEPISPDYFSAYSSLVLAKFDTKGRLQWKKMISYSATDAGPYGMQYHDGKITLLATTMLGIGGALYYLDTLVWSYTVPDEGPARYPFKSGGSMNCVVTFDLEGNVIDQHFLERLNRNQWNSNINFRWRAANDFENPFYIDKAGNFYLITTVPRVDADTTRPYAIVVDDSLWNYFTLPYVGCIYSITEGDTAYSEFPTPPIVFKFSPSWELLWHKPLVSHTVGLKPSWEYTHDSVNVVYTMSMLGLSADAEDNMYLSGCIKLLADGTRGGEIHQYPAYVFFDSTHHLVYTNKFATASLPFAIKIDTSGTVQWSNQLYMAVEEYTTCGYDRNSVTDSNMYVSFLASMADSINRICFDSAFTILIQGAPTQNRFGGFVRLDKETGTYLSHSIVFAEDHSSLGKPYCINNQVIAMASCNQYQLSPPSEFRFVKWSPDGTLLSSEVLPVDVVNPGASSDLIANDSGYVFGTLQTSNAGTVRFGDITVPCNTSGSAAVFALKYDSALVVRRISGDSLPDTNGIWAASAEAIPYISVSPNPAREEFWVECRDATDAVVRVRLYNAQGRLLETSTKDRIRVKHLLSGLYVLKITSRKGEAVRKLLVW